MLKFITTLAKIRQFLGGGSIQNALVVRPTETEAFFIELFGQDWRKEYRAFAAQVAKYREMGEACVPLLALGYQVPELPLEAVFLVANKVLEYRKGNRPPTAQEKLTQMMSRKRGRLRYLR